MAWTTPKTWAFQEGVESSELNIHLRDNLNAIGNHYRIRKSADESVTNNTLQDDDHLLFAIGASETWQFELVVGLTCGATGGFQYTFTVPSGASGGWNYHAPNQTLENFGIAFATTDSFASAAATDPFYFSGMAVNSTTPGNVTFRWAQAVTNATPTTILQNSYLIAHKIG